MKQLIISLIGLITLLGLSACGGGGGGSTSGNIPKSGPSALYTSRDIVKLAVNSSTTIDVRAADSNGKIYPTQFNVTSAAPDTCATYPATTSGKITLNALPYASAGCSDELTITGQNLSKKVTVNLYDPQVMDIGHGLLIRYVDTYELVGHMRLQSAGFIQFNPGYNSGELTLWKPIAPAGETGWYPLGTLARFNQDPTTAVSIYNVNYTFDSDLMANRNAYAVPMIMVKDTSPAQDLLADPTWSIASYPTSITRQLIYSTAIGNFYTPNFTFWNPVCPTGYGALGSVAMGPDISTEPPVGTVKCVKNEFLVQGDFPKPNVNALSWTHVISGGPGTNFYNVRDIDPNVSVSSNGDWIPMWPGTFVVCNNAQDTNDPLISCGTNDISKLYNMLKIPTKVVEAADTNSLPPKLNSTNTYYEDQDPPPPPVYLSSIRFPFTLMPSLNPMNSDNPDIVAAYQSVNYYVNSSPFVYVARSTIYKCAKQDLCVKNSTSGAETTAKVTVSNEWNQTASQSFSKETSMTVTAGGSMSFKGFGASFSVEYGTKYNWTTTTSSGFSSTTSVDYGPYTVPPNSIFEALYQASYLDGLNEDGTKFTTLPLGNSSLTLVAYPQ